MKLDPYFFETRAGLLGAVVPTDLGHRCGYVRVPWWHPWHEAGYDEPVTAPDPSYIAKLTLEEAFEDFGTIPAFLATFSEDSFDNFASTIGGMVRVHGGVTWTGRFEQLREGEDLRLSGPWWIGFDCGHYSDAPDPALVSPEMAPYMLRERGGTVWTHEMVVAEVERLAIQVVGLVPKFNPHRPPLYTRCCAGVRELEFDRRRRNRRKHAH